MLIYINGRIFTVYISRIIQMKLELLNHSTTSCCRVLDRSSAQTEEFRVTSFND